jgi:hypothetical protein
VDELADVFEEGRLQVIPFLKENIKTILAASCDPSKAKLVVTMGTDPIVKFIEASDKNHEWHKPKSQDNVPVSQAEAQQQMPHI